MTSEKQMSKKAMLQAFLLYPLMLGFSASIIITILRVFEPSSSSIKAIFSLPLQLVSATLHYLESITLDIFLLNKKVP